MADQANLPARGTRTSHGLSTHLASVLTFPIEEAARKIATTPALIAEARTELPTLRHRARTMATNDQIKAVIFSRFALYPQPIREDWEWNQWWADYYKALAGLSAEAVNAGMEAWIAKPESEFLPKPGRLRELAMKSATPTGRAVAILSRATDIAQANEESSRSTVTHRDIATSPMKHVPKPKEDREFVRESALEHKASYLKRLAEKPHPAMRDTSGALAEGHHVTQAMLDLMSRQAREA